MLVGSLGMYRSIKNISPNAIFRADYADDDAGSAPADLGVEPEFTDPGDHALDLVFGRVGLSDDKHGAARERTMMSPSEAKCKPRAAGGSAGRIVSD